MTEKTLILPYGEIRLRLGKTKIYFVFRSACTNFAAMKRALTIAATLLAVLTALAAEGDTLSLGRHDFRMYSARRYWNWPAETSALWV